MYGDNYGYRSGLNSSMTTHLAQKAAFLTALCKPVPGDLIVDIGSNDGTLLRSYDAATILSASILWHESFWISIHLGFECCQSSFRASFGKRG